MRILLACCRKRSFKHSLREIEEWGFTISFKVTDASLYVILCDVTQEKKLRMNLHANSLLIFFLMHSLQINNAGGGITGGLTSTTVEDLDAMYHTNVRSVVMVTKKALPKLIENKGEKKILKMRLT